MFDCPADGLNGDVIRGGGVWTRKVIWAIFVFDNKDVFVVVDCANAIECD